jgi:hypothetical protein
MKKITIGKLNVKKDCPLEKIDSNVIQMINKMIQFKSNGKNNLSHFVNINRGRKYLLILRVVKSKLQK